MAILALAGPLALLLAVAAEPTPPQNRGLYGIWAKDPKIAELAFLVGGQAVVQWEAVEPAAGKYDFSGLDAQLKELHRRGRMTTVQLNGSHHPAHLFGRVPYTPKKLSHQVADRQGTLQYWHPVYIKAYLDLLAAFARHLKASPDRDALLGVRMNFNALGTEHTEVPEEDRAPAAWKADAGVAPGAVWTRQIAVDYRRRVIEAFVREFTPEIRVFARNNSFSGADADPAWLRLLQTGKLALFHTSSEMEPRTAGGGQYGVFVRYCRSGETTCYAESWADSWGKHGGKTDARWCSPPQWNYWRMLVDLNCGVSFIAVYGADLAMAGDPEFRAAFDFASKYAGYHASPSVAPGAWVALREGNTMKGDYGFLMRRAGDEMKPVEKAGPEDQRFGAWARELARGATARFVPEPAFARSMKTARLRVTYLNRGVGSFTIRCGSAVREVALGNNGRWITEELAVTPAEIAITAQAGVTLHMVELAR